MSRALLAPQILALIDSFPAPALDVATLAAAGDALRRALEARP